MLLLLLRLLCVKMDKVAFVGWRRVYVITPPDAGQAPV